MACLFTLVVMLCDSDESDWDDPYDIASAEYVEQYNFDFPEGMKQMVFERCRRPYESEMMESEGTGLTHVCQTTLNYPRCELDTVGVEPLADVFRGKHDVAAAAVSPNVRRYSETYDRGTALYDEGDSSNSDGGSIEDRERDTWEDWGDSAFRNGFSTIPSDTDDPQPTAMFGDKLFSDEVLADTSASVHEEVPVLALQVITDEGVLLVPPVIDQTVRRNKDGLVFKDRQMDAVSVLSMQIWDPPILSGTWDVRLSHGDTEWFCLLYSAGSGSVGNGTMAIRLDGQGLDHWSTMLTRVL